jgi:gliding-associated putative ABC transporter substrate-binding component GldG
MKRSKIITQLILLTGILIVINMISDKVYFRADFTADKRYTLSKATKDILKNLNDVVTITAYFTEDMPPQLLKIKQDFKDLLTEYETRSDGKVVFKFVNPNKNQEEEAKAQQKGIRPIMVDVTKKDRVQKMRAYMGAVLQMGEKTEVIPVIQPGAGMEYAITKAIKKISVVDKPKIAILQGHGEAGPGALMQLMEQLSVLYDAEPYTINDTASIPAYYKAIAIIDPKDSFQTRDLNRLDAYLNGGGSIFLAYSNLQSNLNSRYLSANPDIGLKKWLEDKGITLHEQYVVDASCSAVGIQEQQGPFIVSKQIPFPYFPIVSKFADHPVTGGLEAMVLPFVSPISYLPKDSAVSIEPLMFSSDKSGLRNVPIMIDIYYDWQESDFTQPDQILAIAAEGPLGGKADSKMIVITNGSFAVNGTGQQQRQVNQDNVNFASNAIDWLSDDTGLILLRTKGITARPLKQIDDSKKIIYKIANTVLPIIIILLIALFRWQSYQRKKQRWMQGIY